MLSRIVEVNNELYKELYDDMAENLRPSIRRSKDSMPKMVSSNPTFDPVIPLS